MSAEKSRHLARAPAGFEAISAPLHHASTVVFPDVATLRARQWQQHEVYTYGLMGTPTTVELQRKLCEIEQARYCLLAPSGLAAISMTDLALLQVGDVVAIPDNAYAPNRELAHGLLTRLGIDYWVYDPMRPVVFPERTRLVWLEAPGSVTLEMPDLPALIQAAKAVGAWTAIDNTWSAGLAYQPFSHGIDISLQALTKYQSGGADVLMGAVLTQDHDLHLKLKYAHMRLGLGVGADDAWLVLRGLPTLRLRYEQHDRVTRALAQWMKTLPVFEQVLHPALADSPGHEYWQRDFSAAGGLVSVVFAAEVGQARVDAFVDALQVFRIGYSWGGPVSLALPYDPATLRRHGAWQPGQSLVRFCIGLESFEDLRADIEQALESAGLNRFSPPLRSGT